MSENLSLPKTQDRAEIYAALFPQLEAILAGEPDLIANLANTAAALKEAFDFGARPISRTDCLYPNRVSPWGLRSCLSNEKDDFGARR